MHAADKVWITELILIHMAKILGQFVTHAQVYLSIWCLKASTDIIINIPGHPIGLTELLAIMSVSSFKSSVIPYEFLIPQSAIYKKKLILQLPLQSVPNIIEVVSLNPTQARCTRYNAVW
jgi:hypothetical protein